MVKKLCVRRKKLFETSLQDAVFAAGEGVPVFRPPTWESGGA